MEMLTYASRSQQRARKFFYEHLDGMYRAKRNFLPENCVYWRLLNLEVGSRARRLEVCFGRQLKFVPCISSLLIIVGFSAITVRCPLVSCIFLSWAFDDRDED
jgi:hypothetical protein